MVVDVVAETYPYPQVARTGIQPVIFPNYLTATGELLSPGLNGADVFNYQLVVVTLQFEYCPVQLFLNHVID